MPREISIGAIIFRKNKEIKYLLLYRKAHNRYKESWDFPKGNVEKESEIETIKREVKEETGIKKINFVKGFKEKITYFYRKGKESIYKIVIYYLVKTDEKKVKISYEHDDCAWLNYEEALKKLTHKNSKDILTKANTFLKKKNIVFQKELGEF